MERGAFWGLGQTYRIAVKPIRPIIDYLAKQKAGVVAVYEVRSKYVFRPILKAIPDTLLRPQIYSVVQLAWYEPAQ